MLENVVIGVIGIALIALVFVDALWTTLWVDGGAGPISQRTAAWLWAAVRQIVPANRHRLLSLAGPLLLVITLLVWTTLLWAGWVVLFSADSRSILHFNTQMPPDLLELTYFVGYTVFTLGIGDFVPQGWWRIATDLAVASGFVLITLAVSYLLSIISAVTAMRTLAGQITALGNRAESFVLSEWDGRGFPTLATHMNTISGQLAMSTEQHLSYPLLHYFHAANPDKSTSIAVAILDDALTILEDGVAEPMRPPRAIMQAARASVSNYIDTLSSSSIHPSDQPPPAPDLSHLREYGVPVVEDAEFADRLTRHQERRRRLQALVRHAGYCWPA